MKKKKSKARARGENYVVGNGTRPRKMPANQDGKSISLHTTLRRAAVMREGKSMGSWG